MISLQNLTVARKKHRQLVRVSLSEYSTTLNIREKKADSSAWLRGHKPSFEFRYYDINTLFLETNNQRSPKISNEIGTR